MTTTTVEIPTSVFDAVQAAVAARDAGIAQVEDSQRAAWNRRLIDQVIAAFAKAGDPFSANDLRHLIDVPGPLMGARFLAASNRGSIRFIGYVKSTKENTHAKNVNLYVGVPQIEGASA